MKASFKLLDATRQNLIKAVEGLSLDEINKVPLGYNNSVAWNVGHIVVTQQLLHYAMSNQDLLVSEELVAAYRKGTKVRSPISESEWKQLLTLVEALPLRLKEDYANGKFSNYKIYPTSYGYELGNIEDAILFNNVHEGLHLGYVMSMKKQL